MIKLTKNNFWNKMEEFYPNAFEHFKKWIDDYKKSVNWKLLFNENESKASPKFHDLPNAMQIGIFIEYVKFETFENWTIETLVNSYFSKLEQELIKDDKIVKYKKRSGGIGRRVYSLRNCKING